MFSSENILKQDPFEAYIICFWSSVTTNITKHWNGVEVLYSDHPIVFFSDPTHLSTFLSVDSERRSNLRWGNGRKWKFQHPENGCGRCPWKHSSPDRHGSMTFVASQTIDQMKRFCATEVMDGNGIIPPTDLAGFCLEVTSPCHRLVYPFLSQVNCSGGTWSQCSAVLCRGCLLTIRILQMREKYPCQHPPSQCRRLSSYRPSLMHSRTREEQKKLAGEQTFWKPSFSKTMWIR